MTRMTMKQRVLSYIKRTEGPTLTEISRGLGLSHAAVGEAIKQLKADSAICVKGLGKNNGQRLYPVYAGDDLPGEFGVNPLVNLFNRCVSQVRQENSYAK